MSEYDKTVGKAIRFIINDYFWLLKQMLPREDINTPLESFKMLEENVENTTPSQILYRNTLDSFDSKLSQNENVLKYDEVLRFLKQAFKTRKIPRVFKKQYKRGYVFILTYNTKNWRDLTNVKYINQENLKNINKRKGTESEGTEGEGTEGEGEESELEESDNEENTVPNEEPAAIYYEVGEGFTPVFPKNLPYILIYTWLFAKVNFEEIKADNAPDSTSGSDESDSTSGSGESDSTSGSDESDKSSGTESGSSDESDNLEKEFNKDKEYVPSEESGSSSDSFQSLSEDFKSAQESEDLEEEYDTDEIVKEASGQILTKRKAPQKLTQKQVRKFGAAAEKSEKKKKRKTEAAREKVATRKEADEKKEREIKETEKLINEKKQQALEIVQEAFNNAKDANNKAIEALSTMSSRMPKQDSEIIIASPTLISNAKLLRNFKSTQLNAEKTRVNFNEVQKQLTLLTTDPKLTVLKIKNAIKKATQASENSIKFSRVAQNAAQGRTKITERITLKSKKKQVE
jgi:hypothetical protein